MDQPSELVSLARTLERQDFLARFPFPMLLAVNEPVPIGAGEDPFPDDVTHSALRVPEPPQSRPITGHPAVYPVRRVQQIITHGIIVGRASTSDIVIADRQVSKAHALFRGAGNDWDLSDLGSRNGTCVDDRRLVPRGDAVPVRSGAILSFGLRTFYFLDAGSCWARLREMPSPAK